MEGNGVVESDALFRHFPEMTEKNREHLSYVCSSSGRDLKRTLRIRSRTDAVWSRYWKKSNVQITHEEGSRIASHWIEAFGFWTIDILLVSAEVASIGLG
jgi:hypothetical protein